jgi:hypothetical protein
MEKNEPSVHSGDLLASISAIANNALYFNDSSDYRAALHEICIRCGMKYEAIGDRYLEANTPLNGASQEGENHEQR